MGMQSAPTTEMYTRCAAPARDAARTRFLALSSSPLGLPAQCTMVSAQSTAGSIPAPVARSPATNSMPSSAARLRRLSTRTSHPASRRRRTTRRPSVPVPPVTRIGDVMTPPNLMTPCTHTGSRSLVADPAPAPARPGDSPRLTFSASATPRDDDSRLRPGRLFTRQERCKDPRPVRPLSIEENERRVYEVGGPQGLSILRRVLPVSYVRWATQLPDLYIRMPLSIGVALCGELARTPNIRTS